MSVVAKIVSTFDETGFQKAGKATDTMGSKLGKFGKIAGTAFAAAGAAAVAYGATLLVDGVKSALEDQKAQLKLAMALKNVTKATDAQVASVEDYISKTALATGIADDDLRPAFERLTRSTKDISKAQEMMNLALDIAAGTGKDVVTVSNALAKANDGQTTSLKKLGITLGENAQNYSLLSAANKALTKAQTEAQQAMDEYGPKSDQYKKAMERVAAAQDKANAITAAGVDWQKELSNEFAGSAAQAADTFSGKLARLTVAFDEAKESAGAALLDGLQPIVDWLSSPEGEKLLQDFAGALKESMVKISEVLPGILKNFTEAAKSLKGLDVDTLIFGAKLLGAVKIGAKVPGPWQVKLLATAAAYLGLNWLGGDNLIPKKTTDEAMKAFADSVYGMKGLQQGASGYWNYPGKAIGGAVAGGKTYWVGERGPELFTPSTSGTIIPNGNAGGGVTINISGALDPEGVARQIQQILQRSAIRTGSYTNLGFSPVGLASA